MILLYFFIQATMFPSIEKSENTNSTQPQSAQSISEPLPKYNFIKNTTSNTRNTSKDNIDKLLENEKLKNKTESWNKLEKSTKIQLLHVFAEKYGRENSLSVKDIKSLKLFFMDCIEKGKLTKSKDVLYNKDTQEIGSIPSLFFNNKNFTLKTNDKKHVSTLKSLTPKRPVVSVSTSAPPIQLEECQMEQI